MEDGASQILFYWGGVQATFNIPDWKNVVYGWRVFLPWIVGAYLLGSVPFASLFMRLAGGGAIRSMDPGKLSRINLSYAGRWRVSALCLLFEGGKGSIAVWLPLAFVGPDVAFFTSIAVVLGHMFPFWLKFRGGRGVATTIGVTLGLSWLAGAIATAIWLAVASVLRYASLAALAAVTAAPVAGWFLGGPQVASVGFILAVLVWAKHVSNIRRLIAGSEERLEPEPRDTAAAEIGED